MDELPEPMKYEVITASTPNELSQSVGVRLKQGWRPFGSPFLFPSVLCQAVIKGDGEMAEIANALGEISHRLDEIDKSIGLK